MVWTLRPGTANGTRMNDDENPHLDRPLRSFGRIKARPIKPRQAALMDSLLPQIAVPDPKAGPLHPKAMMPEAVWADWADHHDFIQRWAQEG